jgi:hypothetical protein
MSIADLAAFARVAQPAGLPLSYIDAAAMPPAFRLLLASHAI